MADGFTKTQLDQLRALSAEERTYYRQLIRDELADIRIPLSSLSERADEDVSAALTEIAGLKKRMTKAESDIARLKV